MTYDELMQKAIEASKNAYAPYSGFCVGACLLTANDLVFTGCNFENSSYGLTICAERNAIGSAVCAGERCVKAIAIYSPNQEKCFPCGACRQVLHEFCENDENLDVIVNSSDGILVYKLAQLLPESFSL